MPATGTVSVTSGELPLPINCSAGCLKKACNDCVRLAAIREFPSAWRFRETMEGSSLCREQISILCHSVVSYQFFFPSISGHGAQQTEADRGEPGPWSSRREHRSNRNWANHTDWHNSEEIWGQVWVASPYKSPCHALGIKDIDAKPKLLSKRQAGLKMAHLLGNECSTECPSI